MKPKKALLIIGIIFNILSMLFFVGFAFIYFDNDTSGFTDNLTYSEGIVKEISQQPDKNNNIIAYTVVTEENVVMAIEADTVDNEGAISYVNKGDKVIFAFNGSAEKLSNTNDYVFIKPAFLSCDDEIIVSTESYEKGLLNNKNIEAYIGLIASIVFLIVSMTFYFLWYSKIRKIKKYK